MKENKEPDFAFGKKLGVADIMYGNPTHISNMLARLIVCMQETNKLHNVNCEYFRLDFRPPTFDETFEFPIGSLILDMKWGSKRELEEKKSKQPSIENKQTT
jgi:hypothetical protein